MSDNIVCEDCGEEFDSSAAHNGHKRVCDSEEYSDRKHANEEWLRKKYVEEGLSTIKVSEQCSVAPVTIRKYMDRYGIERRDKNSYTKKKANFGTTKQGYEFWSGYSSDDGSEQEYLLHHRLLAVAKYGFESVTSSKDVHHKNGVPWDNRPENIELMDRAEHARTHNPPGEQVGK